ncbi:MAG: polysaccharide deacetylase, partial [Rubrimonas sp.]
FFCRGAESPWTRALLAERGYLYTSNGFDDDLPYRDPSGLIVVPYALDSNDMKFFHPNGFVRAREMVEYVADALDTLEAEAARGLPRLLNIGFHLRIVGRPGRFAAFEGVLAELARRRDRLWIARRADIALAFDRAVPCV